MKIKLPLETLIKGLRKGGAVALNARPKGKIRLSATKSGITIESGDEHGWVVHSIPTCKSVSVQEEGAWNLGGTEVYKMIKALGSKGKKANTTSAPCLTLMYSPPPKDSQPQDDKSVGSLDWVVDVGDRGRMEGSFTAFPDNPDNQFNVFSGKQDGELLLELYASSLRTMIQQVASKTATTLSSYGGLIFISAGTEHSSVMREITPSEIVTGATKDFNMRLTGSTTFKILESILTGSKKTIMSVRIYLAQNGKVLKWIIGNTEFFSPVEPVEPLFRINIGFPRTSFAVQAGELVNRLEVMITPVRASEVHASLGALDAGEDIFKLEYMPKTKRGKYRPNNHPAEATMLCDDIEGDRLVEFSFAPKSVRDFVLAAMNKKGGKIAISIIPKAKAAAKAKTKASKGIMRVQAISNPHLTYITTVFVGPPVA